MSMDRAVRVITAMNDGSFGAPPDVVRRIDALLGDEEEIYIDVLFAPRDGGIDGIGVVLTDTRVILADWSREHGQLGRKSTARVETWSRRMLVAAEIARSSDEPVNGDADWSRDWGEEWPPDAVLTLRYEHQQRLLTLPMLSSPSCRTTFRKLVPSLLADLAR